MLTEQEAFTVRDSAIRVREIENERDEIIVKGLTELDAMIELAEMAKVLAPLCERLLVENGKLVTRVAVLEGRE